MFGQYIPIGLEPPAWRIVYRIRVVPFTLVKVEPPIQRTASKVYPVFLTQLNLNKMLLWKPNGVNINNNIVVAILVRSAVQTVKSCGFGCYFWKLQFFKRLSVELTSCPSS